MKEVRQVNFTHKGRELMLVPLGDVHFGAKTVQEKAFLAAIQFIRETNCRVILMGDLMEFATRHSVGAGVYEQVLTPQAQLEKLTEILWPIRKKVLVSLEGNHEERCYKSTGVDIAKILAGNLGIPYGGYASFVYLRVGKMRYVIHAQHGSSGARYLHTKMAAVMKTAEHTAADVYLYGHTHELAWAKRPYRVYNKQGRFIATQEKYFVLTGGFLGYYGSYAEKKNMTPTPIGFPIIRLDGGNRGIHIST